MPYARIALALCLAASAAAQPPLARILSRVSEEAEVLQQKITNTITQEILEQRTLLPPSRFHLRPGAQDLFPESLRLQVREVVSEYTIGVVGAPQARNLLEFREVVSVDGVPRKTADAARHALFLEMRSPDDRFRKRLLEDLAAHGLVDIATDYALMLLIFSKRGLQSVKTGAVTEARIATDDALVLEWQQTNSSAGELEFRGKRVARRPLQGALWVRKSDGLPLRIQAWTEHTDGKASIRDEATIEYAVSAHGFLAPASVIHRHLLGGQLITENLYRYEPFRLFSAETEIKFTEIPDPTTLAVPPPPTKKQ